MRRMGSRVCRTGLALVLCPCLGFALSATQAHATEARPTEARATEARATEARAMVGREPTRVVPEDEVRSARAALAGRLALLATWCNQVELFEERDKLYRQILGYDPENADARKGLRQTRAPDGTWRDTAKREAKNRGTKALPELVRKRAEAIAPFSAVLVALAQSKDTDATRRRALCDEVLALDPDDAGVHALLGDVKDGDRWVLPETARAKAGRAEIKKFAADALASVAEPRDEPPQAHEIQIEGGWKSGIATQHVRVLATVASEDARKVARAAEAAGAFVSAVLQTPLAFPPRYTVHVLAPADTERFLAALRDVDPSERARLARLEGTGLPRSDDVALWPADQARLLDAAVRHTLCHLLQRNVGLTTRSGWIWEGLGLYLTRELVGTRLTWFVAEDASAGGSAAVALRAKLLVPDANWMNAALVLRSAPDAPTLERVLTRNLGRFETQDMLTGYALAAYLLEGRPEMAVSFVRRSAAGEEPAAVCRATLGITLDELGPRLLRWLEERR